MFFYYYLNSITDICNRSKISVYTKFMRAIKSLPIDELKKYKKIHLWKQ